jgi:hypothetical protein
MGETNLHALLAQLERGHNVFVPATVPKPDEFRFCVRNLCGTRERCQ